MRLYFFIYATISAIDLKHASGFTASLRALYRPHSLSRSRTSDLMISCTQLHSSKSEEEQNESAESYRPGSLMAATAEYGRVPYGEESRKFRRTEYKYQDWVQHRNTEKVVTNIQGMFFSGIIRQLKEEVLLVALAAAIVVVWNDFLFAQSLPMPNVLNGESTLPTLSIPKLTLPALPFTLSSPALGLLLVFKTNASYGRWSEARNTWSKVIAQSRNAIRMVSTFVDENNEICSEDDYLKVTQLSNAIWLLSRTLMNSLSGPEDEQNYRNEVMEVYSSSGFEKDVYVAEKIIESSDRTMMALAHASKTLNAVPVDEKRRVETDKSLVIIGDCIGVCEKIYSSPVPLVYTRHTGRFLSLWMILLPTALYDAFYDKNVLDTTFGTLQCLPLIPATALVGLFLFGIEELAIQLEEPFSILPMQKFCDDIKRSSNTIQSWCLRDDSS